MPVIVVGADTPTGTRVIEALLGRDGEVRAFVSSAAAARRLRDQGVKVATGDVSDGSHVAGAARNCFCAVFDPEAARDGRDRAFAGSFAGVVEAWAEGLADAGVTRVIWIGDEVPPTIARAVEESTAVPPGADIGGRIRTLDDLPRL